MKKKKNLIVLISLSLLLVLGAVATILYIKGDGDLLSKLASSDTFNKGEYIKPDYEVDGVLDEEIWKKAPCITFGNPETEEDEVTFRYHYGERGITASFVVTDPNICYAANAIDNSQIYKLSDAVFLYFDVENDGQITPQTDDFKVCIAADGRLAIAKGSGSSWIYTNESIDYQVVVDGELNKSDGGAADKSWTTELFIPYKTYGIDKDAVMGMMLEWDDSNTPSGSALRHVWYNGGNAATILPELFHPIDKNGLAFAAPEGWVPSMGRFVEDGTSGMMADDVRAVAYYTAEKMQNGAGTVEATFDLTKTDDFFSVPRFSGLLLGVEEVGETEIPGWEAKNQYGMFISNSKDNPQLVVASIRLDEEGKVTYKQIAGGSILDALPNFLEDKVCTVKAAKNDGWIEIYIKDEEGKDYHLYDVYDIEAINGDYVGVRTAVKGFVVRDVKVTTDAPDAPNPYKGNDVKIYNGLLQKLDGNTFCARTAGTTATFGSLRNKYGTKELKTITTSLYFPERPSKPEDKIKGFLLNYNPEDQSYLILDYRHGESKGKEWEEDWRVYIRQRKSDGWGDVEMVMSAEANTTYDFRITPIENAKGATEVYVEYKKSTDTEWKSTYCKKDAWVMSGSEYGVQTAVGNMKFGAMKQVDLGYTRLDDNRYETVSGMFFGRTDGGARVMTGHSIAVDKSINLANKDSYMIHSSYQIVPDKKDSIKGIMFNYNEQNGSYFILDYRYIKEAYRLYVRQYDGKKWANTCVCEAELTENAWYDFNIHVMNGENTTTLVVEYKTGADAYKRTSTIFDFAMPGRKVGYYSTASNGLQFGEITTGSTSYIGAESTPYQLKSGAFIKTDSGVQAATSKNLLIDRSAKLSGKDSYAIEASYQIVPDKTTSFKGIVFNYKESDGSYFIMDYRYIERLGQYYLSVRGFDGKSWDTITPWTGIAVLEENAWYDFRINVMNGKNTTTVVLEYKTGSAGYQCASHIFDTAMKGRQVGYCSMAANDMPFGKIATTSTSYIGAEDAEYKLISGAFKRDGEKLVAATTSSLMLDRSLDFASKKNYTVNASYKIVPDKSGSIKGIVLNYDAKKGSYFVMDYRYIERLSKYYLSVRYYDGTKWEGIPSWTGIAELTENAWYDFEIDVNNKSASTEIVLKYKKSADTIYKSAKHTFSVSTSGRGVGYCADSSDVNVMQFKKITEVKSSESGATWPEEWVNRKRNLRNK